MTVLLCLGAVVALVVVVAWVRGRGAGPALDGVARDQKTRARSKKPGTPLERLKEEVRVSRRDRRAECDAIRARTEASLKPTERSESDHWPGFVTLINDIWRGNDFTLRNRAVGLSWLPFVDAPAHEETEQAAFDRLERDYCLNDDEKKTLSEIGRDPAGQVALVAGWVAACIHKYPAWRLQFFDDHAVRVDLVTEVSYITEAASRLREQRVLLGAAPVGALACDERVIDTYIEKSRVLDQRTEALVDRLRALDEYRTVVAKIQVRHDKQQWFARIEEIDAFEHAVQSDVDRREGQQIRQVADESEFLASVYLDTLQPITATLKMVEPGS